MKQKVINFFKAIGNWFLGFSESIAEARIQQANFYMYGHCKNLQDVERTEKEHSQKEKENGVHWN
jgi:hypothetical protein